MVRPRRPGFAGQERGGPGLTFFLVALVVIAVAGAKFIGFIPGKTNPAPPAAGDAKPAVGTEAKPLVLVYTAHPGENYSPQPPHASQAGDIVTVGGALAKALRTAGMQVELVTPDKAPWDQAFAVARSALAPVLEKGVGAVVDVHRDALEGKPDGYCTVALNGSPTAKILLVVGDVDNPNIEQNLAFAQELQAALEAAAPGITRGVKIQHQAVNGDLHTRSVQVHIGEYGDNNVDEALAASEVLAKALAQVLQKQ